MNEEKRRIEQAKLQTERKVQNYIEEHQMIPNGCIVLAGVSGGSDSSVMLSLLWKLQNTLDFELRVVHVNHQIRGKDADRDEAFVEKMCKDREISFRSVKKDVPALAAEWGIGLEEAGRIVRKDAWQEETERLGVPSENIRIALAHNQNDLAETVLHHLARGSGLRGLASMRPVSERVIRPILCLSKEEIERYAVEEGISFVVDASNASDDYTRNRIRHHILPTFQKEVNEKARENIARTSQLAAQAVDYLDSQSEEFLKNCRWMPGEILLTEAFWEGPEVLQNFAIQKVLERLGGRKQDLSMEHIQMVRHLHGLQVGKQISLPYELCGKRTYEGVRIVKGRVLREELHPRALLPEETVILPEGELHCRVFPWEGEKIPRNKYTKWFDYDKIKGTLTVRKKESGDFIVIHPEGMKKTVNRVMIDSKIPSEKREEIPLVAREQEVLWIVGVRGSEGYRITDTTRQILEITYQGGSNNE
ncbi:MAG: tRNA lysidine(34) synthetase TilS [Eubacteriales bacterium]|nr:tRNA lysidine(34) synthetase TilS [Eubacteriales bacterium]